MVDENIMADLTNAQEDVSNKTEPWAPIESMDIPSLARENIYFQVALILSLIMLKPTLKTFVIGLFAVRKAPIPSWHHSFPKVHAFSGVVCTMPDLLMSALNRGVRFKDVLHRYRSLGIYV